MKTFNQFQEAAFAIPAVGVASKVLPAAAATVGAIGTLFQASKKGDEIKIKSGKFGTDLRGRTRSNPKKDKSKLADIARKKGLDLTNPADRRKANSLVNRNQMKNRVNNPDGAKLKTVIKPKEGEIAKQRELLKNIERKITKPKKGEKKDASKTVKDFLKARKKEGETMYKLKQDAEIADKGPGDLLPAAKRTYLDKLLKNLRKEEVAIANNASSGAIAGLPPDQPPMRKKKRYIYGGTGSRKMWMNNK